MILQLLWSWFATLFAWLAKFQPIRLKLWHSQKSLGLRFRALMPVACIHTGLSLAHFIMYICCYWPTKYIRKTCSCFHCVPSLQECASIIEMHFSPSLISFHSISSLPGLQVVVQTIQQSIPGRWLTVELFPFVSLMVSFAKSCRVHVCEGRRARTLTRVVIL